MIEISRTNLQARAGGKSRKKSSAAGVGKSSFGKELGSILEAEYRGGLEELFTDLTDQEKRFVDSQSLYELERYKALVKRILKMILEKGFETQALNISPRERRMGRAEKTVIKQIDENLIKLSEMVTKSSEAFNLLKTIEEIRGLIFDLVY